MRRPIALSFVFACACSSQPPAMCDGGCASDPIATSVTYRDQDPSPNVTNGTIHIARAADESSIDGYRVYWADKTGKNLSIFRNVAKTGSDLDVTVPSTKVPVGAFAFVVVAVSKDRESKNSVTVAPADNYPRRTDLGMDSAQFPNVAFDPDGQRVVIATAAAASSEVPFLYLCGADGAGCTGSTVAAPPQSGRTPSALIDSGKLLLVTTHGGNGNRATLLACNPDGTECGLEQDLSAGQGTDSGLFPFARVDAGKLLVAARNQTTPWLTRCATSGTAVITQCSGRNVSGGGADFDAADPRAKPSLVVGGGGLAVVWQSASAVLGSHCAIDGTSCAFVDIGAAAGVSTARDPVAAFDEANQKVLALVRNPTDADKPYLIRCAPNLSGCTSTAVGPGKLASFAVDAQNAKLRIVASDNGAALLTSCALDGTSCSSVAMTPSAHDVGPASVFIDDAGQRLYAAWNEDAGAKTVLFEIGLW